MATEVLGDHAARLAPLTTSDADDLIHSIRFSPDGKRLLTASDDWSADVFQCETCGALPATIQQANRRVRQTVTESEINTLLSRVRCSNGKPVIVSYSSSLVCGRPLLATAAASRATG